MESILTLLPLIVVLGLLWAVWPKRRRGASHHAAERPSPPRVSKKDLIAGRLPPGVAEMLAWDLEDYRRTGVVVGIVLLPPTDSGDACPVIRNRWQNRVFPLDKVPTLPLPGCTNLPCCACDYAPVVKDE